MMSEFVELNIHTCRHVFGTEVPILVSDDKSINSEQIEAVTHQYGVAYTCSAQRRSHFAGDLSSLINAIVFARAHACDIAVKVSFRLILLDPTLKDLFADRFQNHICDMIVPSNVRPHQLIRRESTTFCMLPILTDIILIRANAIEPKEIIEHYRHKCTTETAPHASLIEALVFDWVHGRFKGRTHIMDELGVHQPGQPHRFLRKAQNNRLEYIDYAHKLGINGAFDCREWNQICGANYRPKPVVI